MVFGLTVTQTLFDRPLPDWYLPIVAWMNGLDTTTLGALWPVAQLCFGVAIVRTSELPRCAGGSMIAAGIELLAQLVVLGGVTPAPMFMASMAAGIAALRQRPAGPTR